MGQWAEAMAAVEAVMGLSVEATVEPTVGTAVALAAASAGGEPAVEAAGAVTMQRK